ERDPATSSSARAEQEPAISSGARAERKPSTPLRYACPELRRGARAERGPVFTLRNAIQEAKDLGVAGTLFRAKWELKRRSGWMERVEQAPPPLSETAARQAAEAFRRALPLDAQSVVDAVRDRVPVENLTELFESAEDATKGRILCFSRWQANFGQPI